MSVTEHKTSELVPRLETQKKRMLSAIYLLLLSSLSLSKRHALQITINLGELALDPQDVAVSENKVKIVERIINLPKFGWP